METILQWVEALQQTGKAVIVEGPKDRAALTALAIPVTTMLSEQPLFAIAERIAQTHAEAIILTDLDAEGRKLYGRLAQNLQRVGVKVDRKFREFLQRETQLSHIEGLPSYLQRQGVLEWAQH